MRVSSCLIFLLLAPLHAQQEVRIDFAKSHTFESVASSGLHFEESPETKDSQGRRTFILSPQKLLIELPGGLQLQQSITHGSFTAQGDLLRTFECYGDVLPVEEAAQVARNIHVPLKLDNKKLEDWLEIAKRVDQRPKAFITGPALDFYPMMTIEILRSLNAKYPVFIGLGLGWNLREKEKDRTEAWGMVNNARPAAGSRLITLDAPSGKTYGRDEYYVEMKRKEEMERAAKTRSPDRPDKVVEASIAPAQPDDGSKSNGPGIQLWIILLALLIVGGIIVKKAKRKHVEGRSRSK
jgi:hypothetical protein